MEKNFRNIEHAKLKTMGSNYNYALRRISELNASKNDSPSEKDIKEKYIIYVLKIGHCFMKFNELEKTFLKNEYFHPLPSGWWIPLFSRSTYYRIRLNVARKFLFFIEMT